MSNSLDPDNPTLHSYVGSDLGLNSLKMLSAGDTSLYILSLILYD